MKKANKQASHARREGSRDAQDRHEREARMHKSSMESLNRAAAEITFKENNKVRWSSRHGAKVSGVLTFSSRVPESLQGIC
jgi:hypothetical protein